MYHVPIKWLPYREGGGPGAHRVVGEAPMAMGQSASGFAVPRVHPRWPTDLEVRYGAQELASGRAMDISEGGIGFRGEVSYPVGTDIEICFRQKSPVGWFKARGVVRHCGPDRMGAQFVGLGMLDRTRILEMIYEDIATRRK
jgi:PilZ domain-containing protein